LIASAAFFAAYLCTGAAVAADGEASNGHRARLSADLADHLARGSQNIEVLAHGTRASCDTLARTYGIVVLKYLSNEGCVFRLTAGQLAALRQDDSQDHISGNTRIQGSDEVTAEAIGADQVWAGYGEMPALDGSGITIAVIDSGIDERHASVAGKVVATHDFTGGDGVDRFGHGTHVAGIIAGARLKTPDGRDYRGIAPGARLVNLRVLDDAGNGTVADVVEAIDWAIANRGRFKIRVINLSLGAPVLQSYHDDPMCEAVERAVRAGIVVVAAAGNYGRNADGKTVLGSIVSPGNSPYAITVGAVDTHGTPERSDDTVATYSSRGPTAYDLLIKPDVAAPGSHIASAEAAGGYLARTYPERHVTGSGTNGIFQLSGTSMAAAVVSGAASLLLDDRVGIRPSDIQSVLEVTASFMPSGGLLGSGAGEVNIIAAVQVVEDRPKRGHLPTTELAGEEIIPSGWLILSADAQGLGSGSIVWTGAKTASIVWSGTSGSSIVWTGLANSIVWTGATGSSIVWTGTTGNSIVWTGATGNSIVWTGAAGSSIVWTGLTGNSIVWTGAVGNSIVWTGTTAGSIVWTGIQSDSIVWTGTTSESIVWTGALDN
jgi:serine protease AprX